MGQIRSRILATAVLSTIVVSLPLSGWTQGSSTSIDFEQLAGLLTSRLAVQAGEKVLLVGAPGRFDPLVPLLRDGFEAAGAEFLGTWSVAGETPDGWTTEFTETIAATNPEELAGLLADVDASIMLPGADTSRAVYAAIQDVLRGGHGRTIHFHWAGAYEPDGSVIPMNSFIDRFYMHALSQSDSMKLAKEQSRFEQAMRGATIRVTTPAGTDISFQIGERPVNLQDGDASREKTAQGIILIDREIELPAGAIRVAPLEDSVNGRIVFPQSIWQDSKVIGLTLDFEHGVATGVDADIGLEAVHAEMQQAGDAGRAFREFALGFNPLLVSPEQGDPWIPYYGYGAGVVRLSLGDNSELGGDVRGGYVRWNFFVDATVRVGDKVWVEDGRLIR